MDDKVALVVGARGVIGSKLIERLGARPDWRVIGLSRRGAPGTDRVRHLAVDLLDPDSLRDHQAELAEVTHLFYAAYQDRPTWAELVPPNLAMLSTVVDAADQAAPGLRHVGLMQGYKVYGAHLGPFRTPAREDDPLPPPPEFNVEQQRFLEARQQHRDWTWTALRPSVVGGGAIGNPMNLAVAIATYATLCRELGLPFRFPGKPGAYHSLLELTDAELLADATIWAATAPAAENQAFNVANGDLFRWSDLWPRLGQWFGLPVAEPMHFSLTDAFGADEQLWKEIQARHDLAPVPYADLAPWPFADFVLGWDYDFLADSSKLRRAGFHQYVHTETMFQRVFAGLRDRRIIP